MTDPLLLLTERFRTAIAEALGEATTEASGDPALRRSDRADIQANAAMALAKRVGRAPHELATAIVQHLDAADLCARVEIAGPGFINVWLRDDALTRLLVEVGSHDAVLLPPADDPERVVIDYSSPNVAKEMHVGHLRSTILGDALARILEARGHEVVRQNHLGDWGTPFGMLLEHLVDAAPGGAFGSGPALAVTEPPVHVEDLDSFYRAAREKFDADAAFAARARRRVVLLQAGDHATMALWRRLVAESRRYLAAAYRRLGITLRDSDIAGESFYDPRLAAVVAELQGLGLASESAGALCVFPPGFTSKDGGALPLIVRKQDGGYGYATTDLAAIRYRTKELGVHRILYVVGAPQSQHLAMIFAAAKMAGWLVPPVRAEHVAFGSVLGTDKKMFKTRAGDTVKLMGLVDEAEERALKVVAAKNPELDDATRRAVARAVGTGAVKYADLANDRIKDYVFDWDRMLAFEGNTAPYLMYAHARIRAIFRKAGETADMQALRIEAPFERALALDLLGFSRVVAEVEQTLEPHRLCGYLFGVATSFSTFYEACPVVKAASAEQRRSRLALCELTARTLARGLSLLGIDAPDRM
jgi:arginyl-tRNA synthetase